MKKILIIIFGFLSINIFLYADEYKGMNIDEKGVFEFFQSKFENEEIEVNYVIGSEIYYLSVLNKTSSEIRLDENFFFFVSNSGQANKLDISGFNIIPPGCFVSFPLTFTKNEAIFDDYRQGTDEKYRKADLERIRELIKYIGKDFKILFRYQIGLDSKMEKKSCSVVLKVKDVKKLTFDRDENGSK